MKYAPNQLPESGLRDYARPTPRRSVFLDLIENAIGSALVFVVIVLFVFVRHIA